MSFATQKPTHYISPEDIKTLKELKGMLEHASSGETLTFKTSNILKWLAALRRMVG